MSFGYVCIDYVTLVFTLRVVTLVLFLLCDLFEAGSSLSEDTEDSRMNTERENRAAVENTQEFLQQLEISALSIEKNTKSLRHELSKMMEDPKEQTRQEQFDAISDIRQDVKLLFTNALGRIPGQIERLRLDLLAVVDLEIDRKHTMPTYYETYSAAAVSPSSDRASSPSHDPSETDSQLEALMN